MHTTAFHRLLIAAGLVCILGIAGCSNKAAEGDNATATPTDTATAKGAPALNLPEPEEPKDAIPGAPAKKEYRIGVSLLTQDDEFYRALKKGLQDQGDKNKVKLEILSADKDLNKQVNQVQNFVASKVDAIVVCPVDSAGIGGAISAANAANIPVFTADITAKSGNIVCHIASDNVEGGRLAGEYAGNLLNGKGNIAILDLKTVTSVQDRVNGFKAAIAKFPGIKIVADEDVPDAKRENAVPKATNVMTAHADVNLIFGINDNVALGAMSALQSMNNDKVMIIGFDAGPEAQNYISSGKSALKADAIQFPHLIGVCTVDAVVKHLNGEQVPPKIAVPTGLVTADSFVTNATSKK